MLSKIIVMIITIVVGVGAAVALFFGLNLLADLFKGRIRERIKPYFYILPAILIAVVYLIYPTLQTIFYSFANANSTKLVGLANFKALLTQNNAGNDFFPSILLNTLIWIVVGPALCIALGLVVATFADRLRPRSEKLSKTLIFMPMALGGVGAATIWNFVYSTPQNGVNLGIQNALYQALGGKPISWIQDSTGHLNTFAVIAIFLWSQIGFAMVLLSAAIKGVPVDTIEAARIDGAKEGRIFFQVILPQIKVTVVTVFITVLIGVLKAFDLIYVTGAYQFNASVIGVEFYQQENVNQNSGYASAIVVILLVAVAPIMYYQVRQFRAQEAAR